MLTQIDENRVIGALFVTIHLKDVSAKVVFEELLRQCYAELKPFPPNLFDEPNAAKVSIDVDRQPFWTAMNQIAEKTGIDLQQYNEGIRLMRGGFRMNSPFSTIQGPFLVVATQISRFNRNAGKRRRNLLRLFDPDDGLFRAEAARPQFQRRRETPGSCR